MEHATAGDQAEPDRHEAYQQRRARWREKRAVFGLAADGRPEDPKQGPAHDQPGGD